MTAAQSRRSSSPLPRSRAGRRTILAAVWCLATACVLVVLSGCAGYQIGNHSLYPAHVRTVYVPVFASASFRRGLGERLSEAVAKQIELKTPYKVTGDPAADSVLAGHVIRDTKRQLVAARWGDPRELEVGVKVAVSWTDGHGNQIRPPKVISLPSDMTQVDGTANLVPELGHSLVTAQQQAIDRAAEQIVSLMETPW